MGILSSAFLALTGRPVGRFYAGVNFAFTEFSEVYLP
jgi:hypothetical protein